jgi:squalene synthase HpnC
VVAADAYETCLRLARQHYENFPVASRLVPAASRRHIAAIYAFARMADDFADEGDHPDHERLARLEEWQWRLHEAAEGRSQSDGSDASRIFTALMHTMRDCRLDVRPFDDLLSAFAQDVVVKRYETWADLLDYCRRSAHPVGRLVLRVCGYSDPALERPSDAICTALQLTNFWQDLAVDWAKGRLYVPRDVRDAAHADEHDLDRREWPPAWQYVMREAATRTRKRFEEGRPVVDMVRGRLRHELRATWLGGVRVLDKLEAGNYNVFERRPSLDWRDGILVGWRVLRWRTAASRTGR